MFAKSSTFTADLSAWQTNKVANLEHMFEGAASFTSDLSQWRVDKVAVFKKQFSGATLFDSNLNGWNVGSATTFQVTRPRAASQRPPGLLSVHPLPTPSVSTPRAHSSHRDDAGHVPAGGLVHVGSFVMEHWQGH